MANEPGHGAAWRGSRQSPAYGNFPPLVDNRNVGSRWITFNCFVVIKTNSTVLWRVLSGFRFPWCDVFYRFRRRSTVFHMHRGNDNIWIAIGKPRCCTCPDWRRSESRPTAAWIACALFAISVLFHVLFVLYEPFQIQINSVQYFKIYIRKYIPEINIELDRPLSVLLNISTCSSSSPTARSIISSPVIRHHSYQSSLYFWKISIIRKLGRKF